MCWGKGRGGERKEGGRVTGKRDIMKMERGKKRRKTRLGKERR